MKTALPYLALGFLVWACPVSKTQAAEEGFTSILDKSHTEGWKYLGDGQMNVRDGVASTPSRSGARFGLYWYGKKAFVDFTLRLEFSVDNAASNSGILVRFPEPPTDYETAASQGYEIDIFGEKTGSIISPGDRVRPRKAAPLRPGAWNECEVAVLGQQYSVRINGQLVNEFTGSGALSGYIGLQNWKGNGDVHFRNVRVREAAAAPAPQVASGADAPGKPAEGFLGTLSEQAPNALEWALAPLDRTTPPDIRRSLMELREDLLDEAAKRAPAGAEAYKLGQALCNELIAALNERDRALVRAGYSAAQAAVNNAIGALARETNRNSQMRWPQYVREKDQREEARQKKEDGAALARERPALEWAQRGATLRKDLDLLYARFREAARRLPAAR